MLIAASIIALPSCKHKDDSVIEVLVRNNGENQAEKALFAVNISSKTIHKDKNCSYAAKISEENLRFVNSSGEDINLLIERGYKFCSKCQDSEE